MFYRASVILVVSAGLCLAADGDFAPEPMIVQAAPPQPTSIYSTEKLPLTGGSELITIFQNVSDDRVPLLSVLRDTLGDANPENDRIRYVWLLNNARPGWWQQAAAAMPFFYSRAASRNQDGSVPAPLADLSEKHPGAWTDLGQLSLQFLVFDPAGMAFRASTRAYLGNRENERKACFEQALSVVESMEDEPEGDRVFSKEELDRLEARLVLSQRQFGGLVSEGRFSKVSAGQLRQTEEARGRNWEILRQAAESNGLLFDPISLGSREPNYALLWISRADDAEARPRRFDAQFLAIGNPWNDERLRDWKGYSRENRVPLALYDLENARAPLLLVDFRNNWKPKRREIFERSVTDLMRSVFGLSYLHDWYLYATRGTHNFVTGRHGATPDSLERLRGYARLKLKLAVDQSLDPPLHLELEKQLARLALNPLESDMKAEVAIAWEHYTLLRESAEDPKGLPAKIDRDRSGELSPVLHSAGARLLFRVEAVASAGLYRHRDRIDEQKLALLDIKRRTEFHERFLLKAAASPRVEVDFDPDQVRRSLEFLAGQPKTNFAELAAKLLPKTQDPSLREVCLALSHPLPASPPMLWSAAAK